MASDSGSSKASFYASSALDDLLDGFGLSPSEFPGAMPASREAAEASEDFEVRTGCMVADRYEVTRTIDCTDRGWLMSAKDHVFDRDVTLKTCPSQHEGNEALLHELLLSRAVSHDNVCRVHDMANSPLGPVLIMEPCVTTLRKHLDGRRSQGGYSEEEFRSLRRQLAAGLAAIHRCGFIHGALSPANILLDEDDRVMLLFGAGTPRERLLVGAEDQPITEGLNYVSAERAESGIATRSDDVYALGTILWELLTLQRAEKAVARGDTRLLSHISPSSVLCLSTHELRLLFRALSDEPSVRPSARDMIGPQTDSDREVPHRRELVTPGPPPGLAAREAFAPGDQALLVTSSPRQPELVGTLLSLDHEELTIGRKGDIAIAESSLSRVHARLNWTHGSWQVCDLDSTNGTYAGHGIEPQKELMLRHGEEVQLGTVRMMLVRIKPESMAHWRARRFLSKHDGLTGLPDGFAFLASLEQEAQFAQWLVSTLHVARFRLGTRSTLTQPITQLLLRRLAHTARDALIERLGDRVTVGLAPGSSSSRTPVALLASMVQVSKDAAAEVARAVTEQMRRVSKDAEVEHDMFTVDEPKELLALLVHGAT